MYWKQRSNTSLFGTIQTADCQAIRSLNSCLKYRKHPIKSLRDPLAGGLKNDRKTVLSEGCDPRVIEAAIAARKEGVTQIVLIGSVATITEQLANAGGGNIKRIEVQDPTDTPLADEMA